MVSATDLRLKLMTFAFKIRDFFNPPMQILMDAGINLGDTILDYYCGPGSFTIAAGTLVGETGMVYATDSNPVALQMVQARAQQGGLTNITTLQTSGPLHIAQNLVDYAVFFDVLHGLKTPDNVITEIHRVLKPRGLLLYNDHKMDDKAVTNIANGGRFRLLTRGKHVISFEKA